VWDFKEDNKRRIVKELKKGENEEEII